MRLCVYSMSSFVISWFLPLISCPAQLDSYGEQLYGTEMNLEMVPKWILPQKVVKSHIVLLWMLCLYPLRCCVAMVLCVCALCNPWRCCGVLLPVDTTWFHHSLPGWQSLPGSSSVCFFCHIRHPATSQALCVTVCLYVCLSVSLAGFVSICLSVSLSVCLSVCLCVCLSICLSVWACVYVCVWVGEHKAWSCKAPRKAGDVDKPNII